MSKQLQKIFWNDTVERMRNDLRTGKSLKGYFEASYPVKEEEVLQSTIEVAEKPPILTVPKKGNKNFAAIECENAIALYDYYKNIDETQASDPRFWTYLSHVEFRKYVLARWPFAETSKKTLSAEEKDKAITFFLDRWFIRDNDRGLRHQAIARLWWIVHLTYAPWERDPEFFGDLQRDDPYYFTRVVLLTEDIYQTFLERSMGRSNRVLISILEYLDEKKEFSDSRENVRALAKELNLMYGVKQLTILDRQSLKNLIRKIGDEIKS